MVRHSWWIRGGQVWRPARRLTDRWTLSTDRQTLTFVERHQFGAEPAPSEDSYVLHRQPPELWPADQPSKPAEQVYPNIQMLKGVPAERVPSIMSTFSRVLGVACTHCHVEGAMEKDDKPTFAKARRMSYMRNWVAQNAKVETTCWTCHRGHATPEAAPPPDPAVWPADLNLTVEQGAQPASKVYKNLKFFNSTAADIKSAMLFESASLGGGCAHCHVPGAWEKDDKPAKDTARMMLAMGATLAASSPISASDLPHVITAQPSHKSSYSRHNDERPTRQVAPGCACLPAGSCCSIWWGHAKSSP
jgi:hypothetical protein